MMQKNTVIYLLNNVLLAVLLFRKQFLLRGMVTEMDIELSQWSVDSFGKLARMLESGCDKTRTYLQENSWDIFDRCVDSCTAENIPIQVRWDILNVIRMISGLLSRWFYRCRGKSITSMLITIVVPFRVVEAERTVFDVVREARRKAFS